MKIKPNLGTTKVSTLLWKLSIPAILAQIINLLYNVVDRIYIGHIPDIGGIAFSGVGVCVPLIIIISAFGCLVSMGAASKAAIAMGEKNNEKAEKILGNSTLLTLIIGVVLIIVYMLFAKDLLLLFGATENSLQYATSYMTIYAVGSIFVLINLGLNAFITTQGFAKTSMMTVVIGAVLNIILDPILIFGFHMGVEGAAVATVISQGISSVWVICFLLGKKTILKLRLKNLKPDAKIIGSSIALGLSPFIMQSTESIIFVCFNTSMKKYGGTEMVTELMSGGDVAVAAMAVLSSVMQFSNMPLLGLTQGAQPIISFNYGAKNATRVKDTFKLLLISSVAYTTLLWLIIMIFPSLFPTIFTSEKVVIEQATNLIRVYMLASCIFGIQIACQQTFLAIGNAKTSTFLALLRKVILLIPLIYIMPRIITKNQLIGVVASEPVSDIIAVITTFILFMIQFKKALQKIEQDQSTNLNIEMQNEEN